MQIILDSWPENYIEEGERKFPTIIISYRNTKKEAEVATRLAAYIKEFFREVEDD